jgi:hypothetical protein
MCLPLCILLSDLLTMDKRSDGLGFGKREEASASLFDPHAVTLFASYGEFPLPQERDREQDALLGDQLAVNGYRQPTPRLVEVEIDPVTLGGSDLESQVHDARLTVSPRRTWQSRETVPV